MCNFNYNAKLDSLLSVTTDNCQVIEKKGNYLEKKIPIFENR